MALKPALFVVQILSTGLAFAASSPVNPLIREVEQLRNSLPLKDSARPTLTLRLADLYFERGSVLFRENGGNADAPDVVAARRKAASLYEEALSRGGDSPQVEFQLARLYTDLGQKTRALPLFEKLSARSDQPSIQRESILRLAETAEEAGQTARALELFGKSIEKCAGTDLCSYARYRRAWVSHRAGDGSGAISEMKAALLDSRGQVREEALRDLVLFLSQVSPSSSSPSSTRTAMEWAEAFGTQHGRPRLMEDLAAAYFAAGNKLAGIEVLEHLYSKSPTLSARARLIEENYGQRRWDRVESLVSPAASGPLTPRADEDVTEAEKILKRMTVQLDAERKSDPSRLDVFLASVDLYLAAFPRSSARLTLQEGWIAAQTDSAARVEKLAGWIADAQVATPVDTSAVRALRLHRAAAAQKLKQNEVVASEMTALALIAETPARAREYRYQAARAHYELKQYDQAALGFGALAVWPASGMNAQSVPDTWAIQSQNLLMDIYNQRRDYASLLASVDAWLSRPEWPQWTALSKERSDWVKIRDQARFEQASAQASHASAAGVENESALATFLQYCEAGSFLPQSCENAKIIAVRSRNQPALIRVLRKDTSEAGQSALTAELEASGYFAEAAERLDAAQAASFKTSKSPSSWEQVFKLAVLYELGGREVEARRVMSARFAQLAKSNKSPQSAPAWTDAEQAVAWLSVQELGLLGRDLLVLPWSRENRLRLAEQLEQKGMGTPATQKLIAESPTQTGVTWVSLKRAQWMALDQAQRKISFTGKNSQTRFQNRLRALEALKKTITPVLSGGEPTVRREAAQVLMKAYQDVATEIEQSPIPSGLTDEVQEQVKAQIAEMAKPFRDQAQEIEQLIAQIPPAANTQDAPLVVSQAAAQPVPGAHPGVRGALEALHANPQDRAALATLESHHTSAGRKRLSAYFHGRIQSLENEKP